MSNTNELWIARRTHQHLQTAAKDNKLGKRDGDPHKERERERERWTDRERKGREDAVLYEKGGCMPE